jgi:hypothetical protein
MDKRRRNYIMQTNAVQSRTFGAHVSATKPFKEKYGKGLVQQVSADPGVKALKGRLNLDICADTVFVNAKKHVFAKENWLGIRHKEEPVTVQSILAKAQELLPAKKAKKK